MLYSLVTFETKYSRTPRGEAACAFYKSIMDGGIDLRLILGEDLIILADAFYEQSKKVSLKIHACNILPDHVHLLVAHSHVDISEDVRKLKGYSAYVYNRKTKIIHKHQKPGPLWARGFAHTRMTSPNHTQNTIYYVNNNHNKHAEKWGIEIIDSYEKYLKPRLKLHKRL